ncbi:acyltransferase family protein [Legionella longbeachae]|uniref:Putative acetyltransferase n=1 Tax=Legionella longbeachae serogroup 1 (strain NSW150) TaxID=661367 RepID=D3HPF2_LEGLN|nr:acyltransferase family protein [Legionella longbeachae]VEE01292.1 acetyltransferase [Legionella oakridgensis]HBD7398272.1 acyltransferase [Legionella pneumophila]ARB92343.1 acyltransferase [Legionella longbeachae]ARM34476.1 acyltransferase [Legionella longbeachae]EEZ96232.1 putative O-acetyltransferase [Legionella longbeachae D-4968]
MKYRPDIDGLRAIAIILVLIYHGGLRFFPSGFIGVDVFFVISGFLITSIIHESLNNHSFSFLDFYNRRLWRLQPVFVCLLFLTTFLAVLFFLPDDLMQYSKSARKTSLFLSNLFFDKTTTGYFSPETHQLPLLHTWSLSIEWQCYLLLPCLIYGLYRFIPKKYLSFSVYALTLIAFLYSLHNAKTLPAHTYYLLLSRIYEFLIGSCIALIPAINPRVNLYFLNLIGGVALFSLFYIANLHPVLNGYPDEHALAVCLATGVLITLGRFFPECLLSKLLCTKPLVFIGLLSYSLYIWHWVIFSLLRYQGIVENPPIQFFSYLLTFILAYLSWKYIEKPARYLRHTPFRYTLVLLVFLPILVVHLASYFVSVNKGFPNRFDGELASIYQQLEHYESKLRPKCISDTQQEINLQCLVGSEKSDSKKALMIGDSFSNHYWGFMDVLGKDADVTILMQGVSSCITLPGIYLYDWWHFKNQIYQSCFELTRKYYQMIENNHYDYVIIGQLWENYLSASVINHLGDKRSLALSQKRLETALDKAMATIIGSGAKPVLIKATAQMQKNFHDCFFKHIKLRKPYNSAECNFSLLETDQRLGHLFYKMKRKYPQLIILDPKKVQCMQGICKADINGVPVYRDVGHITDYASYQLGTLYLQKFSNPLG